METKLVKIEDLIADKQNARLHSDRNIDAIKASLERFGQQKPIVIDSDNVVRAGNGTVRAAIDLGWTEISAVQSTLEEKDMVAFAIADNRTAELASWDEKVLWETIDKMDNGVAEEMAFTPAELEAINPNYEEIGDPHSTWQQMPEYEHEDLTSHQHIVIHFRNDEDVQKFAELIGQPCTDRTRSLWFPVMEHISMSDKVYTDES